MITIPAEKAQDAYHWWAVYTDDSCIGELDRDEGRGFAEVDQARVKTLVLLPCKGDGPSHGVDIPQGAIPVFFRRRSVEINPLAGENTPRPTTHCIGWKRGEQAVYLFVFDDGSTLLTSDLQAV